MTGGNDAYIREPYSVNVFRRLESREGGLVPFNCLLQVTLEGQQGTATRPHVHIGQVVVTWNWLKYSPNKAKHSIYTPILQQSLFRVRYPLHPADLFNFYCSIQPCCNCYTKAVHSSGIPSLFHRLSFEWQQ